MASGRKRASKGPNKSDFIRQHPNVSAPEVVAAAKAAGIKLSPNLVYLVRSADKRRNRAGGTKRGRKPRVAIASSADVAAFKRLALGLGLTTARQALDDLERGLAELLR